MASVWKFELGPGVTDITAPGNWTPIYVDKQDGNIYLWGLVYPDEARADFVTRNFVIVATGEPFSLKGKKYIGTVTGLEGWMVYHIFEQAG